MVKLFCKAPHRAPGYGVPSLDPFTRRTANVGFCTSLTKMDENPKPRPPRDKSSLGLCNTSPESP